MLYGKQIAWEDIFRWKEKYSSIYYVKIGNNEYVFRLLTRREYFDLLEIQEDSKRVAEEVLLTWCVLFPKMCPEQIGELLAGDVQELLNSIGSKSGFSKKDELSKDLDEYRSYLGILDSQITLLVCKAFPGLRPEEVDQFDYHKLLRYIVLAESMLDVTLKIDKPKDEKLDFVRDNRELAVGGEDRPGPQFTKSGRRLQ